MIAAAVKPTEVASRSQARTAQFAIGGIRRGLSGDEPQRYRSVPYQPMAWRGADLRKDEIAFDLTRRHATALEELLVRFRKQGLGLGQILPQHWRHPALDGELARVFDEIQEGRGVVIVRRIPVSGYSDDDVSTMFWALGTHFGRGVSQSARGDLLAWSETKTPPGEPESARGYTSRRELSLHVDLAQTSA